MNASGFELLLAIVAALGALLALRTLWAARQGIAWKLRAAAVGFLAFGLCYLVLPSLGCTAGQVLLGSLVAGALAIASMPRRSRHIPARVKRQVIARDLKGAKYNPRRVHVDHIWPFARGGSHTVDNLRVVPKAENLRKGARKPRLRDWL